MTDRSSSTGERSRRPASALEAIVWALLVCIVAMRPLISETYETEMPALLAAAGGLASSPATTAMFGFTIWLLGLVAVIATRVKRRRWRLTGLEIGVAILVIAGVMSFFAASNKRLALNASFDWLTYILAIFLLANLTRDRLRVAILLGALTASGLTSALRCVIFTTIEHPETVAQYMEERETFWGRQNVPLDDPRVDLYERRLKAGEASGFIPYSNVQGSFLMLIGLVTLGLADVVRRARALRVVMILLALLLLASIWMTGSLGAGLAGIAGLVLYVVLRLRRDRIERSWRRCLVIGWGLVVGMTGLVFLYGYARGGLPGESLQYRWNYWTVTADIIAESPWWGVGAANFDRAYLKHKPPQFPEEVANPHNFVLHIASEWGIVGGLGLVLALAGGSIVAARRGAISGHVGQGTSAESEPDGHSLSRGIAGVALLFLFARLCLIGLSVSADDAGIAYVFFDVACYGLAWVVSFAAVTWIVYHFGDRVGQRDRLACFCGVAAFLLHNVIEFSLFYPGTLAAFAGVAALLLRPERMQEDKDAVRGSHWIVASIALVGLVAQVILVCRPVALANGHIRTLLSANHRFASLREAAEAHDLAIRDDPYDPAPSIHYAQYLAIHGLNDPHQRKLLMDAADVLEEAERRDPLGLGIYQFKRQLLWEVCKLEPDRAILTRALDAAGKAIRVYPSSPDEHLARAEILGWAAQEWNDSGFAVRAMEEYRIALALNEARAPGELRRWTQRIVDSIAAQMAELEAMGAESPRP